MKVQTLEASCCMACLGFVEIITGGVLIVGDEFIYNGIAGKFADFG